jgi:lysophospholipase L1-like esterase
MAIKSDSRVKKASVSQFAKDYYAKTGTTIGRIFPTYTGLANVAPGTNLITSTLINNGGSNVRVGRFIICSNKDGFYQFTINGGYGLRTDQVGQIQVRICLKAYTPYDLVLDGDIPYGAACTLSLINVVDNTGNFYITVNVVGQEMYQNKDPFADKTILLNGDSIGKGYNAAGSAGVYASYFAQIHKYYQDKGIRVNAINKAIPGAQSEDIALAMEAGWSEIDTADLIFDCAGTNLSPSNQVFTNGLNSRLDYYKNRYPNTRVILMSPTSRADASEATVAGYRTIIQAAAAARSLDYINLALAFNVSDPQFGVTAVEVHPNTVGHTAIATYIKNYLTVNNITL